MAAVPVATGVPLAAISQRRCRIPAADDAQEEWKKRSVAVSFGCSRSGARPCSARTAALPLVALVPLLRQEDRDHQRDQRRLRVPGGTGDCTSSSAISIFSFLMRFLALGGVHLRLLSGSRSPERSRLASHLSHATAPRRCSTSPGSSPAKAAAVPPARSVLPGAAAAAAAGGRRGNRALGSQNQLQSIGRRPLLLLLVAALFTRCSGGSMSPGGAASTVAPGGAVVAAATARAATAGAARGARAPSLGNSHAALLTAATTSSPRPPPARASEEGPRTTTEFTCPSPYPALVGTCYPPCHANSSLPCRVVAHPQQQASHFAKAARQPPPPPAILSSFPTAGTEEIAAPAPAAPAATTPSIHEVAGRLLHSVRAATEPIGSVLSHLSLPNATIAGPAAAVSETLPSTAAAVALNFARAPKRALAPAGASPSPKASATQKGENPLTLLVPSRNAPSVKATTAAPAVSPVVTAAGRLTPFALGFSFIPPSTLLFSRSPNRFLSAAALLLHTREAQHARRRGAATTANPRTLTAAAAPPAASRLGVASLSRLLSTLSPLRFTRPLAHPPTEENHRFCFSSPAACGTADVPPATTGAAFSVPTGAASTAASSAQRREGAVASRVAGGATFFPTCASCSSAVPFFTMAAAAGVDGAAPAAVETPEKNKQEPGEQQQVALKPTKHLVEKSRLDYKPPNFLIDNVELVFDLNEEKTKVTSTLTIRRRPDIEPTDLVLDGEDLLLQRVVLEGQELTDGTRGSRSRVGDAAGEGQEQQQKHQAVDSQRAYTLTADGKLVISKDVLPPESDKKFLLTTEVYIHPKANLQLMGLYKSGRFLVTQCEAEGFRRITFFVDRPDVMSLYRVKLIADKKTCPTLLSNGNQIEAGVVEGQPDKHYAVFEDPFRKPCYLFALVAGELASISETFTTFRGRKVLVRIFSEPQESDKLEWAMQCLLKAMKWDEERFGLEYDLNIFNVVCAADFNMGAMENKSLNIFNSAALLAHPKTSTDANYERVLSVIGHEYFHNWTGNRVTCRDWFQLTLKEGLTVFREQLFSADMFSATVKRIEDVRHLRASQFVEDSGPMAHPIRPETYVAVDNFYTSTVYSKGAEVIRMYHTLLGERGFRRGMDLYFHRHDGQAVTCDDFRNAMADANNRNLKQFELWYSQAGTPLLEVVEATWLGPKENAYKLTVKQSTPPTPRQPHKKPLHIPIKFGLIGKQSKMDLLRPPTQVLELTSEQQTFVISGVKEDCVLSFLRDFSAPVKVKYPAQTEEEVAFLMGFDSDGFSKWQAAYTLASKILGARAVLKRDKKDTEEFPPLPQIYVDAFKATLLDTGKDKSIQAYALRLPDMDGLAQEMDPIDPDALYAATESVRKELNRLLHDDLLRVYESLSPPATEIGEIRDQHAVARRRLRNVLLYFLTGEKDEAAAKLAMKHFTEAKGMTDRFAALAVLVDFERPEKQEALDIFYRDSEGNPLVLNKWFALQAMSECPDTVEVVRKLQSHSDFTWTNPNRLRALMFTFSRGTQFHNLNGKGYSLMADCVLKVDQFNPQVAAHAVGAFVQWRKYDEKRQQLMLEQLRRIRDTPALSPDTKEIVDKALTEDPALTRSKSAEKPEETKEKEEDGSHSKQE